MKQRIDPIKGAPPLGPYSAAIKVSNLIFTSGQIPLDPKSGEIVKGPIQDQVRQTLENLKTLLENAGSSLSKTIKCTVYLQNLKDFETMNEIYANYFQGESPPPARTTIQAAQLPKGVGVEIDIIALA